MPSKPDKFTWPPKPLSSEELSAPAQPISPGAAHLLTHFEDPLDHVLIEEPTDELSGNFASPEEIPQAPSGPLRWLEAFEIHFLGRTAAPWDTRARAANWHPDEPGDYCPRCGLSCRPFELDTLDDPSTCVRCRDKRPAWDRFVRLGVYRAELARAIRELKFSRFRAMGDRLGELLGESVAAELDRRSIPRDRALIVPIPMTPWRRLSRGIDHTLVLARAARRSTGIKLAHLLVRRHRPSQLSLPPSQRRSNISGAFYCRRAVLQVPKDAVLVVIDDVRTTGATMTEACRTLRNALKQRSVSNPTIPQTTLWAATVGVAPRPDEPKPAPAAQTVLSASAVEI